MGDNRVILVLVDGMRPDGMMSTGHDFLKTITARFQYSLKARTVMPSVTLPCHMSLFHSVDPARHGITTNTFVPQMHTIQGLGEVLKAAGKKCAMFTTWEQLRDITRPGSLDYHLYINLHNYEHTDNLITDAALKYIAAEKPDFTFLYLGDTDEVGHKYGWLSGEYEDAIRIALNNISRVFDSLGEGDTMIVLADHGGHDRMHGTDMECDMTIPMLAYGKSFAQGAEFDRPVSIKDVAPTIAKILGVAPDPDWEGVGFGGE